MRVGRRFHGSRTEEVDVSEKKFDEVESLNIEDLDVEELERRIEMAAALPSAMGWICSCDNKLCDNNVCSSVCTSVAPT